jgi:ribosomal protein S18 acetylase RimI-like enzyme
MLEKLVTNDCALQQDLFMNDEVAYNLIHRISDWNHAICYKALDGGLIYAQTPGYNAWLWIAETIASSKSAPVIEELLDELGSSELRGINAAPRIAELFATAYAQRHPITFHTHILMEAYQCPRIIMPECVAGGIRKAVIQDAMLVAQYLTGFSEDAYGVTVDPATQVAPAQGMINSGNLYLWQVEGKPVSMAQITHRSPRHASINAVYTPPELRKRGYASAVVAELCSRIEEEGLIPMLYADLSNPDSNKVYRSIGFVPAGVIADIRFEPRA